MQNYKLAEGQQGEKVLMINNAQSVCPYVPAILLKGNMVGQMQIMRMPCTSLCPLVTVTRRRETIDGMERLYYYTNCGHGGMYYPIDEASEEPKDGGTVLKMV
jgi:hypothetical protein